MGFAERVNQAVLLFRERVKYGPVLIVGNLDTDGITGTSILVHALTREGITFSVQLIKQLHDGLLREFSASPYRAFLFADLGSGALRLIEQHLHERFVFIFDHHSPELLEVPDWIVHVNPHLDGIDGTQEISAAGVCYFFARTLCQENMKIAYLALIGAVGDVQEHMGFCGLNLEILRDSLESGVVEVTEGLRFFGIYTKPLARVLEYSTHPYIPGVTGNRAGAIHFLEGHGLAARGKGESVRLRDLDPGAQRRLLTLIQERVRENFIGPVYLLRTESDSSPFYDIKEFSTVLNACGRMGRTSLGVGVCLGDASCRSQALRVVEEYRQELLRALSWFYQHRGSPQVIEGKGFVIIRAEGEVRDTLIGTLASLISKSGVYPDRTIILSMAHTLGDDTKVSIRVSGYQQNGIDVRVLLQEILKRSGGYGGGHRLAAGATLPQDKEEVFVQEACKVLEQAGLEQHISA